MLALTRKINEKIIIDGGIEIKVLEVIGERVKLGIEAPKNINIYRDEIYTQIQSANMEAIGSLDLCQIRNVSKVHEK